MLSHVECSNCQTRYNGKTGKSNSTAILIYVVVVSLIALGLSLYVFKRM
jgi:LPXTG-motif cell wall-anchored protein